MFIDIIFIFIRQLVFIHRRFFEYLISLAAREQCIALILLSRRNKARARRVRNDKNLNAIYLF